MNASLQEQCQNIVRFVEARRWPLSDEKRLQNEMDTEFAAAGIEVKREVRLSRGADIIDFVAGDVAIEVKVTGTKRSIYRQCERYCLQDSVLALVLATNVAMRMPATINSKPVFIASLGRGHL